MSQALLLQLHLKTPTDERELKGALSSRPYPPPLIKHCYQDDLESMFYVFIWICIEFRGLLSMKCVLDKSHNWIPHEWSLEFKMCCDSKTLFFSHDNYYIKELTKQIHPYFKNLIPIVLEWYYLMRNLKDIHFDDVITLLNKHLEDLSRNEPSPELLVSIWLLKALKAKDQKALSRDEGKMLQLVVASEIVTLDCKIQDPKSLQTSSKGGDGDTDNEEEEEDHVDNGVSWGAAHGHMTAHPGFSKEDIPSQPHVTLAYPTNFNFQHSHNEGDNNMERLIGNNISSTDDIMNKPAEPKPEDLLCHTKTKLPKSSDMKVNTESGQAKEPGDGPKATQLGWYGPRWKNFLKDTKSECRAQHVIENPFPKLMKDLTGSVNEVLMASLVEWLEGG
ncbi:hypothetical protein EV424DRAFT_1546969 [Suillus variegatus]|nr:hypothetical protein EV424DRAFT_1546969 [Suillus variegatus]